LHEVLYAANVRSGNYEAIDPVKRGPKWELKLKVHIPVSKEWATKEAEEATEAVKVYSDGSCLEGRVGPAAVLYRRGEEKRLVR